MKLLDLLAIKGLGAIESEINALEDKARALREMISVAKERRIALVSGLTEEIAQINSFEKRVK